MTTSKPKPPRHKRNGGKDPTHGKTGAHEEHPKRHGKDQDGAPRGRAREENAGIASRRLALYLVDAVFLKKRPFDDALAQSYKHPASAELSPRDRAFARLLAATVLRRHGQLTAVLENFLDRPLPADGARANLILLIGAAQLMFLRSPPHAVIHTAVDLCRGDNRSARFRGLVNAVLRKVSQSGQELIAQQISTQQPARLNVPAWLMEGWTATYGADLATSIAEASLGEAALDITPQREATRWAEALHGRELATGSIRCEIDGRIDALAGYEEGAWWVQDAAAALPARLLGNLSGKKIADLCAAPGGKTAQLVAGGAQVTAVDISPARISQLATNLKRLKLEAELVCADVREWSPEVAYDGILLDAPCTATGTIRRHPDILHLKSATQMKQLVILQAAMLDHVAEVLRPGATLIYCTCSLEREEGLGQIERLLSLRTDFERVPILADEVGGQETLITAEGDIRTLPCFTPALVFSSDRELEPAATEGYTQDAQSELSSAHDSEVSSAAGHDDATDSGSSASEYSDQGESESPTGDSPPEDTMSVGMDGFFICRLTKRA